MTYVLFTIFNHQIGSDTVFKGGTALSKCYNIIERFSYNEEPITDLKNKIRHVYDLNQLLSERELLIFFNSKEFDKMLLNVAQDDVASFKNNNEWLRNHPVDSMIFGNPEKVWNVLKVAYESDFKNLVYGSFPNEKELLNTLILIQKRISSIDWNIQLKNT